MATAAHPMDAIVEKMAEIELPKPGQLIEGKVITVLPNKILVDIEGVTTGIISGREAKDSEDTLKSAQAGDDIAAYVIEEENEDGYIVLSLRKATQEKTWKKFLDAYESGEVVKVKAN